MGEGGFTMKMHYDRTKIEESIKLKAYDERNLTICKCGKHHYPSKLMFIRFLEQFEDIKGIAEIWSMEHWETGEVEIHVDLKYKISDANKKVASQQ